MYFVYLLIKGWVIFVPESTEGVAQGQTTAMKK